MIIILRNNYKVWIDNIYEGKPDEASLFFNNPSNPKRINELYSVRLLLSKIFPDKTPQLSYEGKKPVLEGTNISISHTQGKVAIALSKHKIGIDMEIISEKALKVVDKFFDDTSKKYLSILSPIDTTLLWTAKEAVYKINNNLISFKNDMAITNFESISKFQGNLVINNEYNCNYFIFENFIVTIALEN